MNTPRPDRTKSADPQLGLERWGSRPCRFAGSCRNYAVAVARISDVGDRPCCAEHIAWMTAQGMAFRVLEDDAPVPEWRRRGVAKDLTRSWA